jgi:hypothetical protein
MVPPEWYWPGPVGSCSHSPCCKVDLINQVFLCAPLQRLDAPSMLMLTWQGMLCAPCLGQCHRHQPPPPAPLHTPSCCCPGSEAGPGTHTSTLTPIVHTCMLAYLDSSGRRQCSLLRPPKCGSWGGSRGFITVEWELHALPVVAAVECYYAPSG